jgi:hypothetical protein
MRKALDVTNDTSVAEVNLWNIHAFAIHQMMMWETIYKKSTNIEYTAKLVVASFLGKRCRQLAFYKSVMENTFLYQEVKDLFCEWFFKMQRAYWVFSRLALRWKWRKPRIQIHTDLYMTELDVAHKHTFPLMQLGNVYLFTLSNLVNLITTAICHANHFYHEPLPIKNPYNNVVFSKTDLYNIYFRVRDTFLNVPFFFRRFFECDFNIYRFKLECETVLRERAIHDYVKSADYKDIYGDIETMIRKYDPNNCMNISPAVSRKTVVDTFRSFLATFYLSLYSFDRTQQSHCEMKLSRELSKFIYMNYMFGKKTGEKVASETNPFIPTYRPEYHLKLIHPTPVHVDTEHFMKSHVFNATVFDRYIIHGDVNLSYVEPAVSRFRSADLFATRRRGPNPTTVTESESESESNPRHESSDDDEEAEDTPIIEEEEEHLSEVSDYHSEQEEHEEDYDW